jgi:hypothetical protein
MQNRVLIYLPRHSSLMGTFAQYLDSTRRTVEGRGDLVVRVIPGQGTATHRRQNADPKGVIAHLDGVDQVAVMPLADLPARTVKDLLRLLGTLRDQGVGLLLTA